MDTLPTGVLEALLSASAEPLTVVQVDSPDWPVIYANPAFAALAEREIAGGTPFPDVVEPMIGRDMMREASSALRSRAATTLPVDVASREFLLELVPVPAERSDGDVYVAAYLRTASQRLPRAAGTDSFRALARATRRIRDMSGDDHVTGLMNEKAFRDILDHDWAVAARENASIGLTVFRFDDFDAYNAVFGRHGADSCLRRVAGIISRYLRRASDVAARLDGPSGGFIVALSHGSDEAAQREFAGRIAASVRDLRLHHPRSKVDRFVTVSFRTGAFKPRAGRPTAAEGLRGLLTAG